MKNMLLLILCCIFITANIILSQEDLGKKYFESAISYLKIGNYKQATEDFEAIIKSLPDSSYADDALLELGKYYLEKENNKEKADYYFNLLKEKYVKTENGPAGYYYLGRTNLLLGKTIEDLNNAYAYFERIPILFSKSKWVQLAFYDAGVVQRYLGDNIKAIALLNQAIEKFPKNNITDLSKLELGLCYLNIDKSEIALDYIQQVIDNPYNKEIQERAKNYLSFVFRHSFKYKKSGLNPYEKDNSFSIMKIKNPKQIIYKTDLKNFYIFDEETKSVIIMSEKGEILGTKTADKPQSFFLDNKGNIYIINKKSMLTPDNKILELSFTYELKTKFLFNMKEGAIDNEGNYYIIDNTYKGLFKYDNSGKEIDFPLHRVNDRYKKILIDKRNRIILNLDGKAVLIYKTNAELIKRIDSYEGTKFEEITDINFDDFGNLYILDKERGAIYIYNSLFKEFRKYYFSKDIEPISFSIGEEGDLFIINKNNKLIERYR